MGARHILGNRWRQAQVRISRLVVTTEVILQFDHLTYRKEDIDEIRTRPHLLNNIWGRCLPFGQSTVPMLYLNVTIPWINASLWKWNKNQGRILKITSKMKLRLWYFAKTKDIFRQLQRHIQTKKILLLLTIGIQTSVSKITLLTASKSKSS